MELGQVSKSSSFDQRLIKIKEEIGEVDTNDRKNIEEKVSKANKILSQESTYLKFEIHGKTNEIMIKIIQSETGEVIKELPPEKLVDMIAEICEMAGLFIDKKI
ncbi:flagellar protein FlaG [Clostridium cylindrosporum]|uniref:Flagellar protein FlaG n=1 Tax=Clostridium cylindrosporum DSM 605 TaxID=1121307 RepID=A0A0J8DBM5_CLOCY|nr:flagellar protein FlaG [Clostridium cylindrosporum]KMT21693.1 flagellar protein FlaG [Clostridium cylindrosporum DSM 605]